jgi:3-methyladenine DNA glycosylase AlkD
MTSAPSVIRSLKKQANRRNVEGMARFGISSANTLGVSMPVIRAMGKRIGRDHTLAAELWKSGIHEARILAGLVDEPARVTSVQMDRWAKDFDSWDVCDQVCLNLFSQTRFAHTKAMQWSKDKQEFVKRAGFALMACLAVHDKDAGDAQFEKFLPAIQREAVDERNFVKKAVNWALRQIGKRNRRLNTKAIAVARKLQRSGSPAARWVGNDALRELTGEKVKRKMAVG